MTERKPEKGDILVYEILEYYCPKVPLNECDQEVPAAPGKLISIPWQGNDMQTFHEAIKEGTEGAPICPVHDLQMLPKLSNMTSTIGGEVEE